LSIKSKLEAIIYAAEEPVTLDQLGAVLNEAGLTAELFPADHVPPQDAKAARAELRAKIREQVEALIKEYAASERALEVRQVAGGFRMSTKPEHHDVVKSFAKSLKPPIRLSLQALETLAVIAYKQPVTAPEISEIRGVDSTGVLATLIDRKLITTAGRKAVVGRPILYKTTKDFLLRFGLKDITELPSMEEFEKMTQGDEQDSLFEHAPVADATGVPDVAESAEEASEQATAEQTASEAGE
jgi:segregation and condensation protein B